MGFWNLSSLKTVNLSNSQLTDFIPSELGNLSSLERLDLTDNELTGPFPGELANLLNVRELKLESFYNDDNTLSRCILRRLRNRLDIFESDSLSPICSE